jgi:hypothetical protein
LCCLQSLQQPQSQQIHGYGKLSPLEQKLLDENVPTLQAQAQKGVDFVNKA